MLGLCWQVIGYTVEVPWSQWYVDINVAWSTRIGDNQREIVEYIQLVNQYLWFSLGAVCMAALIYGWFKAMSSQGDENKTKSAITIMINATIGVMIAISSYSLIRIIVNLF
jgi:uncharacterized membrane protein